MNRGIVALAFVSVVLLLLMAPAGGVGTAVAANNSTQETQEFGGPYDISELRENGLAQTADIVESIRALGGDNPNGFMAVRYRQPTMIDEIMGSEGTWEQLEPGAVVHENEIQLYGSGFGDAAGEYTLNVVYWQTARTKTDNGTVLYAANQTIERHKVELSEDELYSFANISLPHHEQSTWEVTMWVTEGGKEVDGARWRFQHLSNPKDEYIGLDSKGDAWGFTFRTAVLPGVLSVIVGLVLARWSIQIAGRGPGYGVGSILFITFFVGIFVSMIAYFQLSVIVDNLPYVMGLSMGVVAYGAGLTFHEPEKRIGFLRRELSDAETIKGGSPNNAAADGGAAEAIGLEDKGAEMFDEFTEAIYLDLPEVPAVRTPDGYRVPVRGFKPFFARLFSDAALLDMSNIATRQKVKSGRLTDIITVDPKSEVAVKHKRARLVRVLPWDTMPDDASTVEQIWAAATTLGIVFGPPLVGAAAFGNFFGIPMVGAIAGVIPTLIMAYTAEDGWIEFESAPPHYQRAEDSLTKLQRAYSVSKEEQTAKEEAWDARAQTAQEGREQKAKETKTVSDRILESLGVRDPVEGPIDVDDSEFEWGEDRKDDEDDDDDEKGGPPVKVE